MNNNYIIFGGTSLIAYELIRNIEKDKNSNNFFFIFCRNKKKFYKNLDCYLKKILKNKVNVYEIDINQTKKIFGILSQISRKFNIKGLFFLIGDASNLEHGFINEAEANRILDTNLVNPINIINFITHNMMNRGFVVTITSMAGIRGRKLRLHYCSAKAGLISYLSGLRQKLYLKRISVIDVRAGYIKTEKFNLTTSKYLVSSPKEVSDLICDSIANNKKIVYSKPAWLLISFVLRIIPEFIFQRLKF